MELPIDMTLTREQVYAVMAGWYDSGLLPRSCKKAGLKLHQFEAWVGTIAPLCPAGSWEQGVVQQYEQLTVGQLRAAVQEGIDRAREFGNTGELLQLIKVRTGGTGQLAAPSAAPETP
ncbi:MAG: hypothetical protein OXQ29_00265, partial [Rhodospirillaceae bacterium]|nr:hypothetical protein [Rhodospirillaceae bacterium]